MNHQSAESRKEYGLTLEEEFEKLGFCPKCGGSVSHINDYTFDFICDDCGVKIEIKGSPKTEKTGNITISEDAWNKYDPSVLIVTKVRGRWLARTKWKLERDCKCIKEALPSTHAGRGGYNGGGYSPSFHIIPVSSMRVIG